MFVVSSAYRPTVLVVEDDPLIRMLTVDAFEDRGWDVIAVDAAEDALGLAVMDTPFDALFTDINLAGSLDGWELAETLREMRPDLPVAYASGAASIADRVQQVAQSMFFAKPYNADAVGAALDAMMRERAAAAPMAMWARRRSAFALSA